MCSEAQNLEAFFPTTYPALTQEVAMPPWVDKILGVAVFSGQLFQLQAVDDYADVQIANRVGGIPMCFYTKIGALTLSPQGTPANQTGDIVPVPILHPPAATDAATVLGLWPVPSQNMPTQIWCSRMHPFQTKPLDPIYIPARFADAWLSYAVARGKEKESMLDEAQYYQAKYEKGRQAMTDYFVMRKQLKTMPTYGGSNFPMMARGSSSVIFVDQSPSLINL
jgi:hypothetical protein